MNTTGLIIKSQQFELEGRGSVTLRPEDHVATGGEGSIYKTPGGLLVKLYKDDKKMVRDGMSDKLKLLAGIKHPYIVSPSGLVLSRKSPVGFYMPYRKGEALARAFTSSYRQRENFTDHEAVSLADNMRTAIMAAHAAQAVLVDANEFNWIFSRGKGQPEPSVIDVDSWSIGRWKTSVIMPSIRDWHTQGFTAGSDWFSYAVVSFQLFSGIHPYKGMLNGYQPNDFEKRMKENKSVFARGVRLNNAVRDFKACIPDPLLEWYEAVFEKKERSIPPSALQVSVKNPTAAVVKRVIRASASDMLIIDLLYQSFSERPLEVYPSGIIRFPSGRLVRLNDGKELMTVSNGACEVAQTETGLLVATLPPEGKAAFSHIGTDNLPVQLSLDIEALELIRYQERLFVLTEEELCELTVMDMGKPLLLIKRQWPVMSASTRWYGGLGIQDSLGAMYLVLPFDLEACAYVRVPELDGKKLVDARSGKRFACLIVLDQKSGEYERYEFIFDGAYQTYQLTRTVVATPDLNLALLPKGVIASIPDDGTLAIRVPLNGDEKLVKDRRIASSWILGNWGDRVVYIEGAKVWSMKMKQI